jgi:hypothetical protein
VGSEGISGDFKFKAGMIYCVTVDIVGANFGAWDFLHVYAAPALPHMGGLGLGGNCQSPPPSVSNKENIMDLGQGMPTTNQVVFEPQNDFDVIWLYPHSFGSGNVVLKSVSISTLCGPLEFKDGLVHSGHHRGTTISAGSSLPGGGNAVTISANHYTTFAAQHVVDIIHDFDASVNSGAFFLAYAGEACRCGTGPARRETNGSSLFANVAKNGEFESKTHANTSLTDIGKTTYNGIGEYIRLYPNPAKDKAFIEISLTTAQNVQVQIFDAVGRIVQNLCNGYFEAGTHKLNINTSDMANGLYNVRIHSGTTVNTLRLSVVK